MWKQVTYGESATSLSTLENYEDTIAEGQQMRLDLNLRMAPPGDIIEQLQDKLQDKGLPATVQVQGHTIRVIARKGFPWLAVLVAAVLGLIVLAVLIVSWQFFKEVKEVTPAPVMVAGIIVGIAFVAVITYVIAREQIPIGGTT